MKNKRVKQIMDSVYNCGIDYWCNLKIRSQSEFPDQIDTFFDQWCFEIGMLRVASLTANQLKGIK